MRADTVARNRFALVGEVAFSIARRVRTTPRHYLYGCLAGLGGFLLLMKLTVGTRPEHFLICGTMFACCVWSDATRRFAIGMTPIVAHGISYDLTHLTEPLVRFLHVHVAEPYQFDRRFFGIPTATGTLTPNEFFDLHHWPWVDLVTGTAYIVFLYWSIGFAIYMSAWGRTPDLRRLTLRFGWTYFAMNLAGFATYYIYPAAPPWYAAHHGFGPADFNVGPNPAGALRWDQLTGLHYFSAFYARSADIFGAIPSLHVAGPLLVALYGRELKKPVGTTIAVAFYLLVCFSAVYLQHHYVLDVLLGSAYAITAYAAERAITSRWRRRRSAMVSNTG